MDELPLDRVCGQTEPEALTLLQPLQETPIVRGLAGGLLPPRLFHEMPEFRTIGRNDVQTDVVGLTVHAPEESSLTGFLSWRRKAGLDGGVHSPWIRQQLLGLASLRIDLESTEEHHPAFAVWKNGS
ncbi:hypothetical protein AAC612_12475, partial [Neisseria gonorrhoeae]